MHCSARCTTLCAPSALAGHTCDRQRASQCRRHCKAAAVAAQVQHRLATRHGSDERTAVALICKYEQARHTAMSAACMPHKHWSCIAGKVYSCTQGVQRANGRRQAHINACSQASITTQCGSTCPTVRCPMPWTGAQMLLGMWLQSAGVSCPRCCGAAVDSPVMTHLRSTQSSAQCVARP